VTTSETNEGVATPDDDAEVAIAIGSWLGTATNNLPGRWELVSRLREGGMGEVFRAKDHELSSATNPVFVAIKIVSALEGSDALKRFRREAKVLAEMGGSNVVHIISYGHQDGFAYLVMELLKGCDLEEHIEKFGIYTEDTLPELLRILRIIAYVVLRAHKRGLLHRDIKPANVFLKLDGAELEPVLLDFGIAGSHGARTHSTQAQTKAGMVIGTPGYMACEQIGGETVGPMADIYALCVILFEALAGFLPFDASKGKEQGWGLMAMMKKAMAEKGAVDYWLTQLPAWVQQERFSDLRDMLRKGLDPDPKKRFASTDEFVAIIDRVAGTANAPRTPTPRPPQGGGTIDNNAVTGEAPITSEPSIIVSTTPRWSWPSRRTLAIAAIGIVSFAGIVFIALSVMNASSHRAHLPHGPTPRSPPSALVVTHDAGTPSTDAATSSDVTNVVANTQLGEDAGTPLTVVADAGVAEPVLPTRRGHDRRPHRRAETDEERQARSLQRRLMQQCCDGTGIAGAVGASRCPPAPGSSDYRRLRCGHH
jgi:serine/threonine protein kinase